MHNKSMISVVLCLITSDGDLVVLLVCVYLVFCIAFSCVALIDVLISHLGQKNDSETCVCVCVCVIAWSKRDNSSKARI